MSKLLKNLLGASGYMQENQGGEGGSGGSGGGGGDVSTGGDKSVASATEDGDKAGESGSGENTSTRPSDAEAKLLKEVMEKKAKLDQASKTLKEMQEKLAKFEGIDPEAVKAMLTEKTAREHEELARKGEWEKLKEQMANANKEAVEAERKRAEELANQATQLQAQIAELTVGSAFRSSHFLANEVILTPEKVRALYGEHFEYKDGKIVAYDQPKAKADRVPLVDAAGNPLSFEEALRKIIDADPDKDSFMKSKMQPGAGSGTTSTAKTKTVESTSVTGMDRIAKALAAKK